LVRNTVRRRELLFGLGTAAGFPVFGRPEGRGWQEDNTTAPGLFDPSRVGLPRARSTDYENDPFIIDVESQLRCTCGCNLDVYTCRTTDFTCGTSPAMHREVVQLVEQGRSAEEILDGFVAEHGEMVLMAPKKEGFNLAAYFVPGAAIACIASVIVWILGRRHSVASVRTASALSDGANLSALSQSEQARLQAELERLEL
jgi:cytochrome c-type biogenesis protein CcmH/NrfF